MMGESLPKWTKLAPTLPAISEMAVTFDNLHTHLPCGETLNHEGKEV